MNYETIKAAAIEIIEVEGLVNLTREGLCEKVGLSPGSFNYVMGVKFTDFVARLRAEGHVGPVVEPPPRYRMSAVARRDSILFYAVELAKEAGYNNLKRSAVAEAAKCSIASVSKYFGTIDELSAAVMGYAVERGIAAIVAQGLANNDPAAHTASTKLKKQAILTLAN